MKTYKKNLAYSEKWICQQYREAARKPEAVRILAELNEVGPETIRTVLKRNGIDVAESLNRSKSAERVFYREVNSGRICHATEAAEIIDVGRDNFVQYIDRHGRLEHGKQIWVRV